MNSSDAVFAFFFLLFFFGGSVFGGYFMRHSVTPYEELSIGRLTQQCEKAGERYVNQERARLVFGNFFIMSSGGGDR